MLHSIISWDCSFRNFFHLVDSLASQDFDKSQYEMIFVEQRSQAVADKYNQDAGLLPLSVIHHLYKDKFNFRCCYLGDSETVPYSLSRINNHGLSLSSGKIISVMDGDMLLPKNFLQKLTTFHDKKERIVNLHRLNASYPVGVNSFSEWKKATIDYKKILKASPLGLATLPDSVDNIGPMISARKENWDRVNGYDENPVFATSASKAGLDVCRRLSIVANVQNSPLPGVVAAHPWHPIGYARSSRNNFDSYVKAYYSAQDMLINFSVDNNCYNWKERREQAASLLPLRIDDVISVVHAASLRDESKALCVPVGRWPYFLTIFVTACQRQIFRPSFQNARRAIIKISQFLKEWRG